MEAPKQSVRPIQSTRLNEALSVPPELAIVGGNQKIVIIMTAAPLGTLHQCYW